MKIKKKTRETSEVFVDFWGKMKFKHQVPFIQKTKSKSKRSFKKERITKINVLIRSIINFYSNDREKKSKNEHG